MNNSIRALNKTFTLALCLSLIQPDAQAMKLKSLGHFVSAHRTAACIIGGLVASSALVYHTYRKINTFKAERNRLQTTLKAERDRLQSTVDTIQSAMLTREARAVIEWHRGTKLDFSNERVERTQRTITKLLNETEALREQLLIAQGKSQGALKHVATSPMDLKHRGEVTRNQNPQTSTDPFIQRFFSFLKIQNISEEIKKALDDLDMHHASLTSELKDATERVKQKEAKKAAAQEAQTTPKAQTPAAVSPSSGKTEEISSKKQ